MNLPRGKMALPRHSAGLTLIEVMVAIVIALILLAVTVSIFVANKRSYSEQEQTSRLQENARYALDVLTRDIRMAGYSGCGAYNNPSAMHNHVNGAAYDFTDSIEGFEGTENNGKWHPTNAAPPSFASGGSDGITLRYLDTNIVNVSADMASTGDVVTVSIPNASQLPAPNSNIAVSDCVSTDVFTVGAVATPGAYPATVTLPQAGNVAVNDGVCTAAANNLCNTYGATFSKVSIGGFKENHYYIGDGDCDNTTADDGQRNLCLAVGTAAGQPLAEGIEHMEILYGEDTNGDRVADAYRQADAVTNWANVVSVQIALLARSPDQTGVDLDAKTYQLLNTNYGPMNDRYRRRVYTATVLLRNRINQ